MENKNYHYQEMSARELKVLLAKKEKEERENRRKEKEVYESTRDALVLSMVQEAKELHEAMAKRKSKLMAAIREFKETAHKYGDIRKDSKGGFSLRTANGQMLVKYERHTKVEYDERADAAEDLIKDFLLDKVKKADQQSYRTIATLLSRNNKGDFSTSAIQSIIKLEDNYDDDRWRKAIRLFKESFRIVEVSNSLTFYEKSEDGKDELIPLNFSTL